MKKAELLLASFWQYWAKYSQQSYTEIRMELTQLVRGLYDYAALPQGYSLVLRKALPSMAGTYMGPGWLHPLSTPSGYNLPMLPGPAILLHQVLNHHDITVSLRHLYTIFRALTLLAVIVFSFREGKNKTKHASKQKPRSRIKTISYCLCKDSIVYC